MKSRGTGRDARLPTDRCTGTFGHACLLPQALFDTLADSEPKVKAETLGDKLSDAQALVDTTADSQALVDTVADSQPDVEAETLGDTLRDRQALVDTLADLRKHWSTCWLI